jgi:hypothetical protein
MTCHGNCSRDGSRRGMFLRNSLSINSTSSTPCDEVATWCPSTRPILELLRYAPHQVTQKLKVKKFEFGLIVRIHLLLRVPGVLDRRRGVGRVGSHTTSATAQWRGLEHLDQLDPLPWEIWARPIGFMQW